MCKHLYTKVHSFCIPSPKLGTTRIFFTGRMAKQAMAHRSRGILMTQQCKGTTTQTQLKRIVLSEKSLSRKVTCCCDSTYITLLKWQNYKDEEQIRGCQRKDGGGVWIQRGILLGWGNGFVSWLWSRLHESVLAIKLPGTRYTQINACKKGRKVNYSPVITVSQCRFPGSHCTPAI